MRLGNGDRSNVEDRRGLGGAGLRLGLGGTLVVAALSLIFGRDFLSMVGGGGEAPASPEQVELRKAGEAPLEDVAVASFNDAQEVWGRELGQRYRPSRLVLFWDGTRSGCGDASSAMGPFYCPLDEKVYIDLGFYRELARRFGAPGEFAQAYVIAHEVGHHVQHVLGIAPRVREAQERDPSRRNALSVRMELQADCLAGAWARSVGDRGRLDPGDVEAGLRAAAAVGDDRIQRTTTGSVRPERFTHGTAEQRARWFRRGYDTASLDACDTFGGGAVSAEGEAGRAPGARGARAAPEP
ncbi:KPN_02809 family neutral zinc metallopeptidase [Anaeromyxobacter terrae]|uniref:KPN_02809 family neutral zinc metallopeptidase n=1 Tax=Anaeromyxobacter terrae TaxID=2925406 RepID=UPI001F59EDA6|nr:neutral zinc metallopeptidase [Anaeromyxobacter sp. SG22]